MQTKCVGRRVRNTLLYKPSASRLLGFVGFTTRAGVRRATETGLTAIGFKLTSALTLPGTPCKLRVRYVLQTKGTLRLAS